MQAQTAPENETAPEGLAAQVVALEGNEACLWFPETNETVWVDLRDLGYEPMPAQKSTSGAPHEVATGPQRG